MGETRRFFRWLSFISLFLVSRVFAADVTWTNTAGGNWNIAANWSSGTVPGASDNAFITNSGSYTVTANTDTSINTVTVGGGNGTQTLALAAGTFTIGAASTIGSNGILSLSATLAGSGDFSVTGVLNWTSGMMGGSGRTIIASNGTLNIYGGVHYLNRELQNSGSATWMDGGLVLGGVTIQNYGTFTETNSGSLFLSNGGGSSAFNNHPGANFIKQGVGMVQFNEPFTNSGNVEVQGGIMNMEVGGTHTGDFAVAGGATLRFNGTQNLSVGSDITGAGSLNVAGGTLNDAGTVNISGVASFTAGTANFNSSFTGGPLLSLNVGSVNFNGTVFFPSNATLYVRGGTANLGTATLTFAAGTVTSSGTVTGTGDLTITGMLDWDSGFLSGSGKVIVPSGGALNIFGGVHYLNRELQNNGTTTWMDGGLVLGGVTIQNYGTFTETNSGSLFLSNAGGPSAFHNHPGANFIKQGAGMVQFNEPFTNSGNVEVQGGIMNLETGGTHTGDFTVASGATLRFNGTHDLSASVDITGAGTLNVAGGTLNDAGTVNISGVASFTAGTANFSGAFTGGPLLSLNVGSVNFNGTVFFPSNATLYVRGGTANLGTATLTFATGTVDGGTLTGSGDVTITGLLDWPGGVVGGSGKLILPGSGTLNIYGGVHYLNRELQNSGSATWMDGGLVLGGVTIQNYGTFTETNSGSLFLSNGGGPSAFNNHPGANFIKQGAGMVQFNEPFTNSGNVEVQGGIMNMEVGGTHTGDFAVAGGATLRFNGTQNLSVGSDITGAGTLNVAGGTFNDAGTVNISGVASFTAGTANFSGAFTGGPLLSLNVGSVNFNGTVFFPSNATLYVRSGTANLGTATLTFAAGILIASGTVTGSGDLTITGVLDWDSGFLSGSGKVIIPNSGTLNIYGGIHYLNRELENHGTALWADGGFSLGGVTIQNYGTFTETNSGSLFLSNGGGPSAFNNHPGANFLKQGAGLVQFNMPFTNSGNVEVQGGTLGFESALIISASSVFRFFIGGSRPDIDFGRVHVRGNAVLNGAADVLLINGFVPFAQQVFQIITWGSQSGGFAQIDGLDLGGGKFFQANCDAAGMSLITRTSLFPAPPSSTNLVNQTVAVGRNAVFCITPLGAEPFTYAWSFNGATLIGETNGCLVIVNAQTNNAGAYCVIVTDANGITNTSCATLTVLQPPVITAQPISQTVNPGSNIPFTVTATGSPPLQYQWRLNGANIVGETNSAYSISNAQPRDGGSYSVVVANSVGVVSSSLATLVVNSNALPFADNFAARGTIVGRSGLGLGTNTTATMEIGEPLHAGKTGGKSLWLQWTAPTNGVAIFNTRGSSFDTLLAVYSNTVFSSLSNSVVASDEDRGGFFTSEAAFTAQAGSNYLIAVDGFFGATGHVVLTWNLDTNITEVPRIIQQPINTTVSAGGDAVFTVFASSSTNLSYQWFFNCCLAIPGATNRSYTNYNVDALDLGYYTVEVTSAGGQTIRSAQASLEIGPDNLVQSQDKFEDLLINGVAGLVGGKGGAKPLVSVSAGTVSSQNISLSGSSTQSQETNHCGIIGGVSRWLSLKALTNGTFVINTIGSTLDTVLAVYVGSNLLNLQFVACDNASAPDGLRSLVRFPATAGVTYMVAVDSVGGVPGIIQVNWGIGSAPSLSVATTNFSANAGGTLTFNVAPTNSSPAPQYQWYVNQSRILDATNATFSLTNLSSRQGGRYSVIVSNFIGSLTSLVAVVNVPPVFVLSGTPTNANGAFRFQLNGNASEPAVLQGTTNFALWQPIFTNQVPNAPFSFTDTTASNPPLRFYRLQPAP